MNMRAITVLLLLLIIFLPIVLGEEAQKSPLVLQMTHHPTWDYISDNNVNRPIILAPQGDHFYKRFLNANPEDLPAFIIVNESIGLKRWDLRGIEPEFKDDSAQNHHSVEILYISIGIILLILLIVTVASLKMGSSYWYDISQKARPWVVLGHLISAVLLAVMFIPFITEVYLEQRSIMLFDTLYALLGVQIYLIASSLIQAGSVLKNRPVPPVYPIHVLFVLIAVSIFFTSRSPQTPTLSFITLLISVTYLPGAILSIITYQHIKQSTINQSLSPYQTITHSQTNDKGVPSSFPEKLLSRYQDISIIGSGGMALVYRAVRTRDMSQVALKIPFSPDEQSGKTFLNEMATWRDLHHKNIVEIYDQNIFPVPYVEMEYLKRSVRDLTYPVPMPLAVSIIKEVAAALAYAHQIGVMHRDIKPGNVLLTDDGHAKLTDWGLARSMIRPQVTKNTSFSLYYASPEQIAPERYGPGDQRTDIYQLGVLLYELICGEPPYLKQGTPELFVAIQQNSYKRPSEYSPSLERFDKIIVRCLKAEPADRFHNIMEFLEVLSEIDT